MVEIGIVCGKCDLLSPMGRVDCPECGHDLAIFSRQALERTPPARPVKGPPPPEVAAVAAAAMSPASFDDDEAPPPTRVDWSPPEGVIEAVLEADAPPPSSVFGEQLKPRRPPSDDRIAATKTTGSAVATSGAFSDKESAVMRGAPPVAAHPTPPAGQPNVASAPHNLSLEELMDQAKHFVCRSCSTPVPMGHKFCGRCGAAVPPEIVNARTQFFGQLQVPGKAKLILIRGEGVEGLSYQLNAEQHAVGRQGQLVFPDDPFVSPKHANLFYRNGRLVVRDEGSVNGVFIRVRGSVDIAPGDHFLCGEQLFRFDLAPPANEGPGPDGTYFYASPKHQSAFRVTQILQGGSLGMTVCARGTTLQIGREGGDLNFPIDLYMSATHCRIEEQGAKHTLTDLNSRNGTYVRLTQERELSHGDYLFIGRKLLRVEITAA